VLNNRKFKRALVLNPDKADLDLTRKFFLASGIGNQCETKAILVSELREKPNSFDTIVCISVLEHIPNSDSIDALRTMWDLLKTGGRLLLSVPCAKEGFNEYIDFNEYGILPPDSDGFVFGQRFYDQEMLKSQIFCITGNPSEFAVFGEVVSGTFFSAREKMLCSSDYPYWKEAYTMSTEYKYFSRVEDLPGLGVIAFEFVKP
jgi:SAM-dependent methyltransferase